MNNAPLSPQYGNGQSIAASTTTAQITLSTAGVRANSVAIYNAGTVLAFVRIGAGAQTATAADMPIPPGALITLTKGNADDTVAAITVSSTATIYVMPGEGV